MVSQVEIKGYDEFGRFTENIDPKGPPVVFFFSGSKTPNGISWCPDCVEVEPNLRAFLSELKKDVIFVYVEVGNREYWKARDCPFRTDMRTRLMVIPTMIKWKGVQRLEGTQCGQRELLKMLFEDDD